uniref:Uncharacterized protein n=1 Tax=Panagrolaimus superbus TaxID=310955 RepID=A0A914YFY0_9BILA
MKSSCGTRTSPPQQQKRAYSPNLPPSQPKLVSQLSPQSKVAKQENSVRNASASMENNNSMINRNDRINAGGIVNRSFSIQSSMDLTSPASLNASTPVSLSMMSPVNSMSPSSSSPISTSTPPQMSPKVETLSPMKLLTLNEIIHGFQLHISPQSYQMPSPSNTQTVKVVVQSLRLFSPQMIQYFGCGDFVRVLLPITDYAQLITHMSHLNE